MGRVFVRSGTLFKINTLFLVVQPIIFSKKITQFSIVAPNKMTKKNLR